MREELLPQTVLPSVFTGTGLDIHRYIWSGWFGRPSRQCVLRSELGENAVHPVGPRLRLPRPQGLYPVGVLLSALRHRLQRGDPRLEQLQPGGQQPLGEALDGLGLAGAVTLAGGAEDGDRVPERLLGVLDLGRVSVPAELPEPLRHGTPRRAFLSRTGELPIRRRHNKRRAGTGSAVPMASRPIRTLPAAPVNS